MPVVNVTIPRAWRMTNQRHTIHYMIATIEGPLHHAVCREGDFMYELLDAHLKAHGYAGPTAADHRHGSVTERDKRSR